MAATSAPGQQNAQPDRSGTLLETDEDIRRALLSGLKGQQQSVSVEPRVGPTPTPTPSTGRPASSFRPTVRPPVPILTVFDDGKADGEAIRIRDHRFIIGRTEGDLRIPLDGRMSSRHIEITLQVVSGIHRWIITDLQSTHGMFVRVSRTALADKAEFLVGGGRYRLDVPQVDTGATAHYVTDEAEQGRTKGWVDDLNPIRPPALTELIGNDIGNRILVVRPEYWIGSDPTCAICRPDDPYCEPRHVRLFRGPNGTWQAEHNKTQNGLWLRVSQIAVDSIIQFQAGEQRFRLKLP